MAALLLHQETLAIENKVILDCSQCAIFDPNLLHKESLFINNKLVVLQYGPPNSKEHVYLGDIQNKQLYSILNIDTKPAHFRINYTIQYYNLKIYIFGGLTSSMEPCNTLETFDMTTYRWERIVSKGKAPEPRHSSSSIIHGDKLYIFGGTVHSDLFNKENTLNDIHIFDMTSSSWYQIK